MRISEVEVDRLFVHAGTGPVAFAPEGMTVVVGPNGAGKTALALETVCWVLWGKTTRGTTPDGEALVQFEVGSRTYVVRRVRAGRKIRELYLGTDANAELTGQTPTETQAKIDALVGSWDRFRSTRVFSNRLRQRFGSATDKERKALLESVLGLERYERAAKLARAALAGRQARLAAARTGMAAAAAALEEARRALAAVPPSPRGSPKLLAYRAERLERAIAEEEARLVAATAERVAASERAGVLRRTLDRAEDAVRDAARDGERAARALAEVGAREAAARSMGVCPVCLTPAAEREPGRLLGALRPERERAEAEVASAGSRRDLASAEVREVRADHQEAARAAQDARRREEEVSAEVRGLGENRLALREAASLERQRGELEAAARAAVEAAVLRAGRAEFEETEAERACLEAEAAALALGSRGARVSRMEGALARLSREANAVLARLPVEGAGPMRVLVTGTRELARGGEVDEVSVRVEGTTDPEGEYDGVSDGERVRLDAALMLGMSRVAGDGEGLVVFDEIFDPLDELALEAVVEILTEMSRDRQVVVITHNPRFLERLPAAAVWRISRATGVPVVERPA